MPSKPNQLAICGGPPTIPSGPPNWPIADESIQAALADAYASGNWGRYHGPFCESLKKRLGEQHNVDHVKLCSSGTIAVELALRGFDVQVGDEVILGGYDFPGNFHCIEQTGARPVLADIDPTHGCIGVAQLVEAYRPKVRAAVVSHLHSGLAPMKAIMEWARQNGVLIIEDACQAPGATVDGQRAGTWGDIGILSFGGSKLLTAGRGGALLVQDAVHMQRIRVFAERGNDAYPLSELQAAVVLPQLDKLDEQNRTRQQRASVLQTTTADIHCLTFVGSAPDDLLKPSYYKIAWWYNAQDGKWTRNELMAALRAEGVAADAGFRGFVRRSDKRCRHGSPLSQCKIAANSTLLVHHPVLLEPIESVQAVGAALSKVINGYATSNG